MAAIVEGEVSLASYGCYQLGSDALVWPSRSRLERDSVVLPDGRTVSPGDVVSGSRGCLPGDAATQVLDAASRPRSSECLKPDKTVAVLQQVSTP